jgi:hypothetical protein
MQRRTICHVRTLSKKIGSVAVNWLERVFVGNPRCLASGIRRRNWRPDAGRFSIGNTVFGRSSSTAASNPPLFLNRHNAVRMPPSIRG